MITKKYLDNLTYEIIGSAIEVHKEMGRGLLESVYHQCLIEELKHRKINFLSELKLPVIYKGKLLNVDFRCDLYIESSIVVELKSVQELIPIHEAQLLTYMKLLNVRRAFSSILIHLTSLEKDRKLLLMNILAVYLMNRTVDLCGLSF